MQRYLWLFFGGATALAFALVVWQFAPSSSAEPGPAATSIEVVGKTEPAPGYKAVIAPQTSQPVRAVKVSMGSTVARDQVVIELDDEEDRAEVKAKAASLRQARGKLDALKADMKGPDRDQARAAVDRVHIETTEAKKTFDHVEKLLKEGSISDRTFRDARTAYQTALETERIANDKLQSIIGEPMQRRIETAQAEYEQAEAELEKAKAGRDNQTLRARIAGTVTWLDVSPGAVGRPGQAVWGEIVDARVLDVRCEVKPEQLPAVGDSADVWIPDNGFRTRGKVVAVGIAASGSSGLVPFHVRIDNADGRLCVHVPVHVAIRRGTR